MSNKQKGTLFIILSAFFFAMMSLFVKLSGNLPSVEKSFFRNLIAMIIAAGILIKINKVFHIKKKIYHYLYLGRRLGLLVF